MLAAFLAFYGSCAYGKSLVEAVSEIDDVSGTDPNGVKWMIVCISLLFTVALSLITATFVYYDKSRRKKK
jgi:hypothetical protein